MKEKAENSNFLSRSMLKRPGLYMLLACLLTLLSLPGIRYISFDYSVRGWFMKSDPLLKKYDEYIKAFGSDDNVLILMHSGQGVFNEGFLKKLSTLTTELQKLERVKSALSITNINIVRYKEFLEKGKNFEHFKGRIINNDFLGNFFISKDQKTATVNLQLKDPSGYENYAVLMNEIDLLLKSFEKSGDISFFSIGASRVSDSFMKTAEKDLKLLLPLMLLFLCLILFFSLRSFKKLSITLLITGLTLGSALGIAGYFKISLNNLSGMVPLILMAITVAVALHFTISHDQFSSHKNCTFKSLQKVLIPTFLTALTTAICFISLSYSELKPIQDFGLLCSLGVMFSWLYSLLIIIPFFICFPDKKKLDKAIFPDKWLTAFLQKHYLKLISCFLILLVGSGYIAQKAQINSNPFDYFSSETWLAKSNEHALKQFGGLNGLDLVITEQSVKDLKDPDNLKKLKKLERWLKSQEYVNTTFSFLDYYRLAREKIPEKLFSFTGPLLYTGNDLVSIPDKKILMRIIWNIQGSRESISKTEEICTYAQNLGLKVYPTGQEHLFQKMNSYIVKTFFTSILFSVVLVGLLMCLVLKSLRLGLLSLLPNFFPIVIGTAAIVLTGKSIDLGTVLVASVCFGIATDDTIHFLIDFKEQYNLSGSAPMAIIQVFSHTGKALCLTTLTIAGSMSIFLLADFIPNFTFGFFSALVLVTALITDLFLLPALLFLIFKKSESK